jgi:hypothetical protein
MCATRSWSCRAAALLAAGLFTTGCATLAPSGWLSTPQNAQTSAYGGWMHVVYRGPAGERIADGELIAVSPDTVHVLGAAGLVSVPVAAVTGSVLETYDPRMGLIAGAVFLGTLSTISNGVGLVLTAPIWLLVGAGASASALKEARVREPLASAGGWLVYRPYARFPAGLSPGLDRSALRPKRTLRPPRDPGLW